MSYMLATDYLKQFVTAGMCPARADAVTIDVPIEDRVTITSTVIDGDKTIQHITLLPITGFEFSRSFADHLPPRCRDYSIRIAKNDAVMIQATCFCESPMLLDSVLRGITSITDDIKVPINAIGGRVL